MSPQFLADFATMSTFGATNGGGVDRQAATSADREVRQWFSQWLTERGFTVFVDDIGNQFGLREVVSDAPYVLVGSHLDSQPLAGRFDGAYGVLAAAHAVSNVLDRIDSGELKPKRNIAVVNWFNEEGSRFSPSMMGSGVYTGKLALEEALSATDHTGVSVREALAPLLADADAGSLPVERIAAYAEIHIEQGRLLENSGTNIGLVEGTWAAGKYRVKVKGEQSHTGATVMADRKDALYGAALLIAAVRELSDEFEEGMLHTSVSEHYVWPNSPVTIAREVHMNLDLRSPDEQVLAEAMQRIDELTSEAAQKSRTAIEIEQTHHWGLIPYQPDGVQLAADVANELGLSASSIKTVAGHDSTNLKDSVFTVMLFVPSIEGISHNERENTSDSDLINGLDQLTEVCARLVAIERIPSQEA